MESCPTDSQEVLISVIIPTYLEEKNVENCLKSVKSQNFDTNKIEIVVVDSDSFDKTKVVSKKYADKIINLEERGVGKARNIGAKVAKSEILLFLDADTILDSNFISEMWRSFSDPNVVCVSGAVMGLEKLGIIADLYNFLHYGLLNMIAMISTRFGFSLFPSVCCACRKSMYDQVGGYEEHLAVGEDILLSLKMRKVGKCLLNRKAVAYTSIRRIKKNGRIKSQLLYFRNYFKIFFQKKKPWIYDFPHVSEC